MVRAIWCSSIVVVRRVGGCTGSVAVVSWLYLVAVVFVSVGTWVSDVRWPIVRRSVAVASG